MNLLRDPWVPVREGPAIRHVTLEDVLCTDEPWDLAARRDDMELTALQLLICLTQTLFRPEDAKALRARESTPLTREEYRAARDPHLDHFDLRHETTPFMQSRGVRAAEVTPIQKLFVGLPEGNNHALFNEPGEVDCVCAPCAAVALFNQASNCPSFGGGFKGSLRGGAPITTLVEGRSLRTSVWRNVLSATKAASVYTPSANDQPSWVDQIERDEVVVAGDIGLMRGLLWQPAHVELLWNDSQGICAACGASSRALIEGFVKEKFPFEVVGVWRHPHGAKSWALKSGKADEWYASFTTSAPAWTRLTSLVIAKELPKEGQQPALVISQFKDVFPREPLALIVGGYRNKQASILERRHELIALSAAWEENSQSIEHLVGLALAVRAALRGRVFGFGKQIGVAGLADRAEDSFDQRSEPDVHGVLKAMDWRQYTVVQAALTERLCRLANDVFTDVLRPYQHEPKMLRAAAVARRILARELNKLRPERNAA